MRLERAFCKIGEELFPKVVSLAQHQNICMRSARFCKKSDMGTSKYYTNSPRTEDIGKSKGLFCHSGLYADAHQIPRFFKGKLFKPHVADRLLNSLYLNRTENHE